MNPTLMAAVLDAASFLELCSDDVLDPDVAVEQLENMVANLHRLTKADLAELVTFTLARAEAEQDGPRREFFKSFAEALQSNEEPRGGVAQPPRVKLLFYVHDDLNAVLIESMRQLVVELAAGRTWTVGPPVFMDATEDPEDPEDPEDLPLRTVGGILEQHSLLPPWGEQVPPEVDRAMFEETKATVAALSQFSARHEVEIALELDDEFIGVITGGVPDDAISEGLLGEWERTLVAAP